MCGRYLSVWDSTALQECVDTIVLSANEHLFTAKYNNIEASPGMEMMALTLKGETCTINEMHWGFEGMNNNIINARIEDVHSRNMFKNISRRQRCILPAAGYYEWRKGDGQKFLIRPVGERPCFLAGIYRSDNRGKLSFVILTRQACGEASKIHDRMPVLFDDKGHALSWLKGTDISEISNACTDLELHHQGDEQLAMFF